MTLRETSDVLYENMLPSKYMAMGWYYHDVNITKYQKGTTFGYVHIAIIALSEREEIVRGDTCILLQVMSGLVLGENRCLFLYFL